jgi:nitrogen regulatory protein PII
MDFMHECIVCIVNSGYSETVMEAAREAGAGGGTVIGARGTATKDAEKFFGITVHPEKEIVMILVNREIRDVVLHALYQKVGLQTKGQGIAFALPVDSVVGMQEQSKQVDK